MRAIGLILLLASILASQLVVCDPSFDDWGAFTGMEPLGEETSPVNRAKSNWFGSKLNRFSFKGTAAPPADDGKKGLNNKSNNSIDSDLERSALNYEFAATCGKDLEPKFTKPPVVHFFSAKAHSSATSACGTNVEIKLQQINGKLSVNPKLNKNEIKRLLIDTKLFDSEVQTYFITHGFQGKWSFDGVSWQCDLKDLILDNSAANVFIVDWSGGSTPSIMTFYSLAVINTVYVGALLGEFIQSLVELTGQPDGSQYHMIGHSLGAHISGFAGYYLKGTLGRITALDSAGPCFKAKSSSVKTAVEDGFLGDGSRRLSRQSAKLVVALHTDMSMFGLKEQCSHYDVYVNGGFHQPECDKGMDTPLAQERLFIMDFVVNKLPCQHMYAYKLLNQFVNFEKFIDGDIMPKLRLEKEKKKNKHNRCYSVSYQCTDWHSFMSGECGFCKNGDQHCIFIGLSEEANQPEPEDNSKGDPNLIPHDDHDDDTFNDEYDFDHDLDRLGNFRRAKHDRIDRYSLAKHYIKSGPAPFTCMYQYQIIIAAKKLPKEELEGAKRVYYYLHVPLELSGRFTGDNDEKLKDRLIQISHKLRPDSAAYEYLRSEYMKNTLGKQDSGDELDLYTALITFEPVTDTERCESDATNGAARDKNWEICSPLDNIKEARLWASSVAKLEAVAWIGFNYMSGLNYEQRARESYVFNRDLKEPVKQRDEIHESSHAKMSQIYPKPPGIFGHFMTAVMNFVDINPERAAKNKFNKNRSRRELLYAVKLVPTKLG